MKKSVNHEKQTIREMIRIYCRSVHGGNLCADCICLLDYAFTRIDKCRFGIDKPACNDCTVHCYKPEMREKVKKVMRFAGPRMIYTHPFLTLRHLIK